jgi:hypothetical protein
MSEISVERGSGRRFLDMNGYQWTVVLAAWLGWGFDVFDGMLFNFVAPNCVPRSSLSAGRWVAFSSARSPTVSGALGP